MQGKNIDSLKCVITTVNTDVSVHNIIIDGSKVKLNIWDTAGQEKIRHSMPLQYYRNSHGCILVYDITSSDSFKELASLRDEVLLYSSVDDPSTYPFILLGNKTDLENKRKIHKSKVDIWCNEFAIPYFEVSAYEGKNIQLALENIGKLSLAYYKSKLKENDDTKIVLEEEKSPEKSCFCMF